MKCLIVQLIFQGKHLKCFTTGQRQNKSLMTLSGRHVDLKKEAESSVSGDEVNNVSE